MEFKTDNLFDSFYENFILRDLMGYIFPGALIIISFSDKSIFNIIVPNFQETLKDYYLNETLTVFMFLGSSYLLSFLTELVFVKIGIIRYSPIGESRSNFVKRRNNYLKKNPNESRQRERYVAFKIILGNLAIATGIIALVNHSYYIIIISLISLIGHYVYVYYQAFQEDFEIAQIKEEKFKKLAMLLYENIWDGRREIKKKQSDF